MATLEQEQVISLPTPHEGVVDELYFELLADRPGFLYRTMTNFRDENPYLCRGALNATIPLPNRDQALELALFYYEIFSRSARRGGQRLLLVEEQIMDDFFQKRARQVNRAQEDGNAAIISLISAYHQEQMVAVEGELGNEELGKFWVNVLKYQDIQKTLGIDPILTESTLKPLFDLRALLHAQQRAEKRKSKPRLKILSPQPTDIN